MKKICILHSICCAFSLVTTAHASISSDNAHLIVISKQNLHPTGARSTSAENVKLAVYFLPDGDTGVKYSGTTTNTEFTCPEGKEWCNGICDKSCDQFQYPYIWQNITGCAVYNSCQSACGNRYLCESCKDGYTFDGSGGCTEISCDGYPLDETQASTGIGTRECIHCGENYKCRYTDCYDGYTLYEGACYKTVDYVESDSDDNSCTGSISKISNCLRHDTCTKDGQTYYTCTKCERGYELYDDGKCREILLDYVESDSDDIKSDSDDNNCTGFRTKILNCLKYDTCTKSGQTYYSCTKCEVGYELKNEACQETITAPCEKAFSYPPMFGHSSPEAGHGIGCAKQVKYGSQNETVPSGVYCLRCKEDYCVNNGYCVDMYMSR